MKTLKFFSNVLMVFGTFFLLVSCETTELVEPSKEEIFSNSVLEGSKLGYDIDKSVIDYNDKLVKDENEDLFDRPGKDFAIYQLIEFNVDRLTTVGSTLPEDVPVKDEEVDFTHANPFGDDELILTGTGQGWSEELGRSLITTEMRFVPRTMELRGMITCEFYPSENKITLKIEGGGSFQKVMDFDGPHTALVVQTTLVEGSGEYEEMSMTATSYLLNASELFDPEVNHFSSYLMTVGDMY